MTKLTSFLLSLALAIAVWVVAPMLEPSLGQVVFVGVGRFAGLPVHGSELAALAAGLALWITALHFPPRPRHIWIRHSAPARSALA